MGLTALHKKTGAYETLYPEAIAYADTQFSIGWTAEEYPVSEDIQDVITNFTEAETHAITYALKLFTLYEVRAGVDYWAGRILKKYPSACIQRMAMAFANAEINMHAPFYNELNKSLNLDTKDFYTSYVKDPVLKSRMDYIDDLIRDKDDALSVAVFSIVEGAVLYSTFAFLKHFRANGKNKLKNLVSGINASVRDENLHSEAGAWLFSKELEDQGNTVAAYQEVVTEAAKKICEHEKQINAKLFERGPMEGYTLTQADHFVESRIDLCLQNLGMKAVYNVKYNPVADWFYDNINALKLHDFFNVSGSDYRRDWPEDKFLVW